MLSRRTETAQSDDYGPAQINKLLEKQRGGDRLDPWQNLKMGADELEHLRQRLPLKQAIAGYNSGYSSAITAYPKFASKDAENYAKEIYRLLGLDW